MSDPDTEAFEHYEDPRRREPAAGRPRRRPARALTEHVPVGFPAATIEVVRKLAEADGMTVSAWIRRAVEAATRSRTGSPADESARPAAVPVRRPGPGACPRHRDGFDQRQYAPVERRAADAERICRVRSRVGQTFDTRRLADDDLRARCALGGDVCRPDLSAVSLQATA